VIPEPRRPSLAELTQELVNAIRAAQYTDALTADPGTGQVTLADGSRVVLDPHYDKLAASTPEERASILGKVARQMVSPAALPPTWAEAKERIRLQAKPRMAFEADALRREAGQPVPRVWTAALTPHLSLEMVVPVHEGVLNIPIETLAAWGVTVEEALDAARRHDLDDARKPWLVSAKHPGLFRSPWQDGRDGARMLTGHALSMPLHGRAVAVLPAPSMLLVAGSDDEQGLRHVAEKALSEVERTGRQHVLRAFRIAADGGGWDDWLPPPRHPAYAAFRMLQALQERREYAEQADLVDALARAKNMDAMPLPRLEALMAPATGVVMTVTTWRAGRPAALPKADAIVLRRGAKTLGLVMWDDLIRAVPGAIHEGQGYPVRHPALDFPEDWQLSGVELRPWSEPP
jgi:hypothetical protein